MKIRRVYDLIPSNMENKKKRVVAQSIEEKKGKTIADYQDYKFVGYLDIDPTQYHPNYTADIREGVAVEYFSCEPSENLKELFPEEYGMEDDIFENEETEQAKTCSVHRTE